MQQRSLPWRTRLAIGCGKAVRTASRKLGRGSGGMIGGKVALALAPQVLRDVAAGRDCVIVTGTNGKSTTTRMVRTALEVQGPVASNLNGDNMPSGISTALMDSRASQAALEVDEMHVLAVADDVRPAGFVLLNLSRDQLDRVGEIASVERRLREAVNRHPQAVVVANCDDPLITSVALDAGDRVVWVSTPCTWGGDAVSFPRGGRVVQEPGHWEVRDDDGNVTLSRPSPHWWLEDVVEHPDGGRGPRATLCGPDGLRIELQLAIPGLVNLGNAAQAIALAHALAIDPQEAARAVETVTSVAGRYALHDIDGRVTRVLLAKNPAGWQEAMTMIDPDGTQLVIGVNGQIPDGQDLSWLWDVDFGRLHHTDRTVVACGERAADLAVRLEYAGISCKVADTPKQALAMLQPGPVDMLLNYTALRDFNRVMEKA